MKLGGAARSDRLASRKPSAVTGDMCPIGTPPTAPSIRKPKCSARGYIPW
ncbi:MAG: hypothetical protein U0802_22495 [Candidatus Binatia bacterium]